MATRCSGTLQRVSGRLGLVGVFSNERKLVFHQSNESVRPLDPQFFDKRFITTLERIQAQLTLSSAQFKHVRSTCPDRRPMECLQRPIAQHRTYRNIYDRMFASFTEM